MGPKTQGGYGGRAGVGISRGACVGPAAAAPSSGAPPVPTGAAETKDHDTKKEKVENCYDEFYLGTPDKQSEASETEQAENDEWRPRPREETLEGPDLTGYLRRPKPEATDLERLGRTSTSDELGPHFAKPDDAADSSDAFAEPLSQSSDTFGF